MKNLFSLGMKEIGIISILFIIVISYSFFFYLQYSTERNIRNNLFEQQKERQLESTKAIAAHITSDLESITTGLHSLANSVYLQQGELFGGRIKKLMEETYLQMNATIIPEDNSNTIFILDKYNVATMATTAKEQKMFIGMNFSDREWVKNTRATLLPVFSNGFEARSGKYTIVITYPIINRETGQYLGMVGAEISTIELFERYGNIYNIKAQYLAILDRNSIQLIHPIKSLVGTPFFGSHTQQVTGHNEILNNMIRKVMSGKPDFAVYDFLNGQRLNIGYPVFIQGRPTYFVFVITPTSLIYSQVDNILLTQRTEAFLLLAGITAAIAVLILFLIKWNSTLDKAVKIKTKQLDESNQQLLSTIKQLGMANEQLKKNDEMQKEFINIAAHELRTPTQSVLGYAEMLEMEHNGVKEYVNPILRNAKRLQRLTGDLLDVATIESHTLKLNKEKFNLNELILHAIEDAKNQIGFNKKISIFYNNKGEEEPIIEADKGRLTQVLSNLIGNAIKFTNDGTITINSELKCCSNSDNATYQVIISVTDTGKGIDSQIFPGLFSKFASKSKGEGTGLGLFICKGIIESHGGKIWAENNCNGNKGCTFYFSIPTTKDSIV